MPPFIVRQKQHAIHLQRTQRVNRREQLLGVAYLLAGAAFGLLLGMSIYVGIFDNRRIVLYVIAGFYLLLIGIAIWAGVAQLQTAKWWHSLVHTFDAEQRTYARNNKTYLHFDPRSKVIIHAEKRRSGKSTYVVYILQLQASRRQERIVVDSSTNQFEMLCVGDMIAGHVGAELHFEPLPKKKGIFG